MKGLLTLICLLDQANGYIDLAARWVMGLALLGILMKLLLQIPMRWVLPLPASWDAERAIYLSQYQESSRRGQAMAFSYLITGGTTSFAIGFLMTWK